MTEMLSIPFKSTQKRSFLEPFRSYISTTFEENPDTYQDDILALDSLRSLATQHPEAHDESANNLLRYYFQLGYTGSKFKIEEATIPIVFTWSNAFTPGDALVSSYNLGYEKASVLFNLGSLYSLLGVSQNTSSPDGIKRAAGYFQQSAGVFQFINESLESWGILGSANSQLLGLVDLMLACAQEVFLCKAVEGKMKDGTLAKLAIQASDFFQSSFNILRDLHLLDKQWLSYIQVKTLYLRAQAHYYRALEFKALGKYGLLVGWLQSSQLGLKQAQENSLPRNLNLPKLLDSLKSFSIRVDAALREAAKDNDLIYMEAVPKPEDLPCFAGAKMVSQIPYPGIESMALLVGRPLFNTLVPFTVHQSASKYTAKKDLLVKELLAKLSESTSICQSSLASLNLPGSIQALEQPVGIPGLVLDRVEEVRQSGGATSLLDSFENLQGMSKRNLALLREGDEYISVEEIQDFEMRGRYTSRWNRVDSVSLTKNMKINSKEYADKLLAADQSNSSVTTKIERSMSLIEKLAMTRSELESYIPASTSKSMLAKDPRMKQLKVSLDDLNTNIKKRQEFSQVLNQIAKNDDIGKRLLQAAAESAEFDEKKVFDIQMKPYAEIAAKIDDSIARETELLQKIEVWILVDAGT